ncbi:MAG: hypothetical protein CM15mP102_10080 [Flavobacteriales bacterium]|nr:MAG: hypothetical protein CM15mP102_10080 [Flavobacteriales bacterium]
MAFLQNYLLYVNHLPYNVSGGSDDIGDVSWKVPTVVLGFHLIFLMLHFTTGQLVSQLQLLLLTREQCWSESSCNDSDRFLTKPEKLAEAKSYFDNVQSKEDFYRPMISETDPPPFI